MAHFLGRLATSGDSEKGRVGREWRAQCANRGRARKQKSFNPLFCWTLFYRSPERVPITAFASLRKAPTFKSWSAGLIFVNFHYFKNIWKQFGILYNAQRPATVNPVKTRQNLQQRTKRGGAAAGGNHGVGFGREEGRERKKAPSHAVNSKMIRSRAMRRYLAERGGKPVQLFWGRVRTKNARFARTILDPSNEGAVMLDPDITQ